MSTIWLVYIRKQNRFKQQKNGSFYNLKQFPHDYKSKRKSYFKKHIYIHHQHCFLFHSYSVRQPYPVPVSDLLCQTFLFHRSYVLSVCRPSLLCSDQSYDNGLEPFEGRENSNKILDLSRNI